MKININGIAYYYETHGDPAQPPLYFFHGAPGLSDCRSDAKVFAPLQDEYHLVLMDLRGSGRSEPVPPYTHEQWTSDVDALRSALGHKRIRLHGGSYGGFLALEYCLRYPERVSHLVLRDTSANGTEDDASLDRALRSGLPDIDEAALRRLFAGRVQSNQELRRVYGSIIPLYTTTRPTADEITAQLDSISFHYQTHNYAFSSNKPEYNVAARLTELPMPTLVNVGRHDWITPVACSELIAREIPQAKLHIFEQCGHSPQIEASDEYLRRMRAFLRS